MKRIGHITGENGRRLTLVEAMADYGSVQKAYNKARKCKRYRRDVLIFTKDKEENLERVRNEILGLSYEPGEYRYFKVYEPKERQIMALPFYDRVVQHAINNVLEPIFEKRFNVLKAEIRKVIKDAGALALIDKIIDHNGQMPDGTGIPVGNLTSQLFANIYLNKLDQYIKHTLGAGMYMRYMDDFIILSPDKEELRRWLADIERFLREELILELNPKTAILCAKNGIDFVGYKHRATHRKVRPDSIKRIKRTIKKYERGEITRENLQKSIASWTGHAGHADSLHLRKKIIKMAADAQERAQVAKPAGAGVST